MKSYYSFKSLTQLLRNMGFRYVFFRIWFEIQRRTGWLKIRFPEHRDIQEFITLNDWRNLPVRFFNTDYQSLTKLKQRQNFDSLRTRAKAIDQNEFQFFNWKNYKVSDWHTNPATGFSYDPNQHWSEIPDFLKQAGDIKYVWEKSRFTFLYDLIRYDFHFQEDQSKLALSKIESWIDANPVNCGPNWKCSQEITLRILNWTFALHYYKNSVELTEILFSKICNSIYRQMQHVEENISFSRIAVRNNHAITETLGLYLIGLLYPFFSESKRWKEKGRKFFEEEIAYQIYEDGTFLQFSMNYHRVVVQLLTWAIKISELNKEPFSEIVYDRALKSLKFLRSCQDDKTGWLPNYGNNDGALFFPLTDCHYRDFRPQLNALAKVLNIDLGYANGNWDEESFWMGGLGAKGAGHGIAYAPSSMPLSFTKGGYYVLRDTETITFLRCGNYKDRPFQADNLHLDIWLKGENILRDAGSFGYNTDKNLSRYFMGTASHNTVMLGDFDQMKKGRGFVWYDWIKESGGEWRMDEGGKEIIFEGYFEGFKHLGNGIRHHRRVTKKSGILHWVIEDRIENIPSGILMKQLWHPSEEFFDNFLINAFDELGNEINPIVSQGWYSEFYGKKEAGRRIVFRTSKSYLKTVIQK